MCGMWAWPSNFYVNGLLRTGWGGGGEFVKFEFFVCLFFSSFFFIENITGKLHNIQNSKLCFHDMKVMSLRNGGDIGKQLVLRTRCLLNHHHS